jgi:hypothetical protein
MPYNVMEKMLDNGTISTKFPVPRKRERETDRQRGKHISVEVLGRSRSTRKVMVIGKGLIFLCLI